MTTKMIKDVIAKVIGGDYSISEGAKALGRMHNRRGVSCFRLQLLVR